MNRFCSRVSASNSITLRLLFVCFSGLLWAMPTLAQSTYGAILGTVRDSNGALLPGAQVTLVNTGTTATHTADTDSSARILF